MALGLLIVITLASVSWSLWVRRFTWHCGWEAAATICILFQGVAVLLMSPLASATLGVLLHRLTGVWNVEDYLSGDCYIVSTSAIAYRAVAGLSEGADLRRSFRQYVERPATLCIPLLLGAFLLSRATDTYYPAFFNAPTDGWLKLYWLILVGTLVHLQIYGMLAFWVLRGDPRSRAIADIYLISGAAGVVACIIKGVTALVPRWQALNAAVWVLACAGAVGVAGASIYSWRQKTEWIGFTARTDLKFPTP